MAWFLYLISLVWIAFGTCAILYTQETRNTVKTFWTSTNPLILVAILGAAGILFIISAGSSTHPWIIRLFGLVALLKGGFVYLNPQNMARKVTDWYIEQLSDQAHRCWGIVSVILGTAIFSWVI